MKVKTVAKFYTKINLVLCQHTTHSVAVTTQNAASVFRPGPHYSLKSSALGANNATAKMLATCIPTDDVAQFQNPIYTADTGHRQFKINAFWQIFHLVWIPCKIHSSN
jgi:hypothetical protein